MDQIRTIFHIQTLKLDIIQTTVLEIFNRAETETTQTIGIDNTQIIDHESIQTIDQTIIIITIDHVTIPRIEILIMQIDKEFYSQSPHRNIAQYQIHSETIEVAHLNIKDKSTKYNQLKKPNQTLPVLITQKI